MCNAGQLSDSLASLDGKANGIVKLRHSKEDWRNQWQRGAVNADKIGFEYMTKREWERGVCICVTLLLIYPPSNKLMNFLDNISNKCLCTAYSVHQVDRHWRGYCQEHTVLAPA